ncbi:GspH/FimT family protein [Endozoicomonas sp. SCSIO W0465]|uniref:GspH/FimT family pseudopilin n=1 Tax=Endozoicomonas sp. SCSIO W0465 TaxID=2918516 RepID=UPI002075BCB8|nr:GspH/FimT family protein [Endozoicomonas sp. SCSIO W0465]USE37526.1 GspH/FimT family pseudopilin [Endozoicomonas sp. SCSIO W0465]
MKYMVGHRYSANYVASSDKAHEGTRYHLSGHPPRSPYHRFSPSKAMGVSLIELLVSLSIAAILIAASAPNMKTLIVNNRIENVADELYGNLMLARSEAVKRQRTVTLCSTVDDLTCDESNSGWHHGWLIFTDASDDGLLNDNDQLIRRVTEQSALITILWNRGYSLRFNSRGQTNQAGTFQVCDQGSNSDAKAKAIIISMTGRLRTEEREACG